MKARNGAHQALVTQKEHMLPRGGETNECTEDCW